VVLGADALNAFAYVSGALAANIGPLRVIERVALGSDLKTTYGFGAA
jgi:hypothetical protein